MEHIVWNISPIAFEYGSFRIFWYGILFAAAIFAGFEYMKWVYKQEGRDVVELDTLLIYIVIGIVVGARLGHCLFYDPAFYLSHPLKILAVWEGGLASHGGGSGVILGLWLYTRKHKMSFIWLLDRVAIPTALFGVFVRMGNLMNSEIVGKPSELPWAMVFSRIDDLPRHPTQLYEAMAYLFIFLALTYFYKYKRDTVKSGFLFGTFLILVFGARFLIELVKVKQAAYSSEFMINTGQALSIPFLLIGVALVVWSMRK